MKKITVDTSLEKYPIYFCGSFGNLLEAMNGAALEKSKICIITDSNVNKLYAKEVSKLLMETSETVDVCVFDAGEKSKTLDTIQRFYEFLVEKHFDRKSTIIGLGGGVTGDMAGFAAATYMRGINFVQIPTTLLAQVDSSVGGKVGVDFKKSKNMVGAFYQPKLVYINTKTLDSLPEREFAAGMGEVIKYGLIVSKDFYVYLKNNMAEIKDRNQECITEIICKCCEFKANVVAEDEKENGIREILNFGHTIGHAVETLLDFELLHGECVGIGMLAAMEISVSRGFIEEKELFELKEFLSFLGLPTKTRGIDANMIYNQMFMDKKVSNNKLKFVLLEEIGKTIRTSEVTREEIFEAITFILED